MLRSLNIENIAIIEKCNIEFNEKLNILTGETGAGKSIIIDSINACLGHRTSKDIIRTGKLSAKVSAFFENISDEVLLRLSDLGIDTEDKSLSIMRTITPDKNSCRINGMSVSVTTLREIGKYLINIHGQHDNQALLDSQNHCGYIDLFAKNSDVLNSYFSVYNNLKKAKSEYKKIKFEYDTLSKQQDLLRFQVNEIETANLVVGERDQAIEKRKTIQNSEKIKKCLSAIKQILNGNEEKDGVLSNLTNVQILADGLKNDLKSAEQIYERLSVLTAELSDVSETVRGLADSSQFDPKQLAELDERIEVINSVIKKYGGSEEAALDFYNKAVKDLESITKSDENLLALEEKIDGLKEELYKAGLLVTKSRKDAAVRFEKEVLSVLKYLEMPDIKFVVNINQGIYTKDGCDIVEFLISPNLGQELKPLAKIASGGELSRIMLSIKSVLAKMDVLDTMIFDEIDTGISGIAANRVASQLKKVATDRQVICVTHLAQIAAKADDHYLISKKSENGLTLTDVTHLDIEGRKREVARIIGSNVTERSLAAATEMLESNG